MNRDLDISVTSWEVIVKACKLDESLKLKKYFTELMLQIFEQKHADFPFRYSYWSEATTILPRINEKAY